MLFDRHFTVPSRLSILVALLPGEAMSFTQLKQATSLADGNLYTQAQRLVDAKYVSSWRESRGDRGRTFFRITDEGVLALTIHTKKLRAALEARKPPVTGAGKPRSAVEDDSRVW